MTKGTAQSSYRAHQVALWNWLVPRLEKVGTRYWNNNSFGSFPSNTNLKNVYTGPTRPWLLHPAGTEATPIQDASTSSISATSTDESLFPSLQSEDFSKPLGIHTHQGDFTYNTALSVTIAIGCSLLVLNLLVFAAFYYKKDPSKLVSLSHEVCNTDIDDNHDKISNGRDLKASPSQCGTMRSSSTIRSSIATACTESEIPHEWPPDYMTCYSNETGIPSSTQTIGNGNNIILKQNSKPPPPPRVPIIEDQPLLSPVSLLNDTNAQKTRPVNNEIKL